MHFEDLLVLVPFASFFAVGSFALDCFEDADFEVDLLEQFLLEH
jgi:hypothetical protein